jgi:hypothetical protein
MTKKEKQSVLIFKNNIFRRIDDLKYANGEWKKAERIEN